MPSGPNLERENSDPSSNGERQAYLRAIVERIEQIREQERFDEFLARCKQIGVSPNTVKRWLKTPDAAPRVANLDLAAAALRDLGFPVKDSSPRELAIAKLRAAREAKAKAIVDAVDRAIQDAFIVEDAGREVTLLTAQLVGSRALRHNRAELDWLKEIRIHNRVAEECIKRLTGRVIKFLGGAILAEFEGRAHAERAILAGLAIIKAIEVRNKKREDRGERKLETAIGVATGKVFWFKYQQSNEPDPQGPTVNLALRLCGLAGREQLVCSEKCFSKAGGEAAGFNSSPKLHRFLEGSDESVAMRLILPEGRACQDIRLVGHRREVRPDNLGLREVARRALKRRELNDAEKSFRDLVAREPGNFEANFRLAELLLGRSPKRKETRAGNIKKASEHLRTARQINPDSWRVWFLASAARKSKFEDSRDYADLDQAIKHAEEAINKATEFMDTDGMDQTKLVLAGLLLMRSKGPERDGSADLAVAAKLCNEIMDAFNGVQTRRKSNCLVTTAMVQLAQGGKPRSTIKEMLEEANSIDTDNANAHRAFAEFLEGGDGNDSEGSPAD